MSSTELLKLISKPWANVNDIKKIASCGRDSAIDIRNTIMADIEKSGKILPASKVKIIPMTYVIQYLGLDIEHISLMAQKEKLI